MVLAISKDRFGPEMQQRFERWLTMVMRTSVRIKTDSNGEPMIHPFDPSSTPQSAAFNTNLLLRGDLGIVVYLEIDNLKCDQAVGEHCFDDAEGYANLFGAMMSAEKLKDDWGILQVGSDSDDGSGSESGTNLTGILIGAIFLMIVAVAVFGMLSKKRKAKGVTWFPDGFRLQPNSLRQNKPDMIANYDRANDNMSWSEESDTQQYPPAKRSRFHQGESTSDQTLIRDDDADDGRQWTQQHLHAADIRNPEVLGALTPPQNQNGNAGYAFSSDVDIKGPMGMTPLMIASFRGGGLDTGDLENMDGADQDSPMVIQDLINQGADLNAQMEKTGETPLHLAARYARADSAKKLLDNGADPNAQDNTGRTPLHAAVAADAQGVFHILLKNRATNLDAKTFDGTTPLILAARMGIEGVVEKLIESNAEINQADNEAKTALHWAANVNHVDAVNVLLVNGANRDATDNKEQTPLYLACREGSYQSARSLLDHGANRDIADNMDRLPRDIAQDRMHHDIVKLLVEHTPPQVVPAMQMAAATHDFHASPPHPFMQQQPLLGMSGGAKPKITKKKKEEDAFGGTLPKQKRPSARRKKLDSSGNELALSPDAATSPYSVEQQRHPLAVSQPNFDEMMANNAKQPPSYENAVARSMRALPTTDSYQQQQQQQQQHCRQQSVPVTAPNSNNFGHLSPPHSNHSSSQVHSPPSTGNNMLMSPPQSIQSNGGVGSPPAATASASPTKCRQQQQQQQQMYPTSPTHFAAMRGATMQQHFNQQQFQQQQQQQFVYPTDNFLTPSPDSQYSSGASPQTDWSSDGVHSPPHQQQQQQQFMQMLPQQQQQQQQQADPGVLI